MNKVLIIDAHPIVRLAVRMLLAQEGFEVIAEASSVGAGITQIARYQPNLVVLELNICQPDGVTIIQRIRDIALPPRIVVFTALNSYRISARCMQEGAYGIVNKTDGVEELIKALRAAESGYKFFPSREFEESRLQPYNELIGRLSCREIQVLQQLAQGTSNKKIAERMLLSHKTVSTYKTRLLQKLETNNLLEATLIARHTGLI